MTALTKDREVTRRANEDHNDPVAAAAVIHAGALVVLNATGNAAPGTTATGLVARGVAQEAVDNSAGADGDLNVETRKGTFRFINDGSIDRANIGDTAYIVDDQTVADTDGGATRSAAGEITDVDSAGVWVKIG